MSSLTVNYLGIPMASPVIGASGTVGYGLELNDYIDMKKSAPSPAKAWRLPPGKETKASAWPKPPRAC